MRNRGHFFRSHFFPVAAGNHQATHRFRGLPRPHPSLATHCMMAPTLPEAIELYALPISTQWRWILVAFVPIYYLET